MLKAILGTLRSYIETHPYDAHPYNTDLYRVAQECCYGLNDSELRCLREACEDILENR